MHLTDFSDYSLRVLIYLNQTQEQATLSELADVLGLSRNHLIKISAKLAKSGYVDACRGRSGGLRIRKDAGRARLGAIIRDTEERIHLAECFSEERVRCSLLKTCVLKGYFHEALDEFMNSLNRHTLNDITPKELIRSSKKTRKTQA